MKRLTLLTLCFLIMVSLLTAKAEHLRELNVTLFPDGWAHVEITEQVSGQEKNLTLALPTDSYEYLMVINENNIILNYTAVNRNVFVELENSSRITVIFQTQALTSKRGAIWNFSINYDADITYVTLPPKFVMIGVSEAPERVMKRGDSLSLAFRKGSLWISYMPIQPSSTVQPSSTAQPSKPSTQGEKKGAAWPFNPLYLLVPAIIALIAFLLYKKGGKRYESEELDPDEKAILDELMRRGGSMYQSELIKALGLPKTTVWRKINRLNEKGVIRVEKSEKGNIIHLR
ncbi:MAG: helix-turn-helix transcriptional regulator [Candidatus Methanodesulfokora sp.]